jgi:hypothetical protein
MLIKAVKSCRCTREKGSKHIASSSHVKRSLHESIWHSFHHHGEKRRHFIENVRSSIREDSPTDVSRKNLYQAEWNEHDIHQRADNGIPERKHGCSRSLFTPRSQIHPYKVHRTRRKSRKSRTILTCYFSR